MKHLKRTLALLVTAAMLFSLVGTALAANSNNGSISTETTEYTYTAPTEAMEVDDNIITASAHRAASPILGILGVNATSGFGMINGSAPASLAEAQECAALATWSTLNENPDPYYWNYFYNFYAEENGLELSDDALINGSWSGSPGQADTTLWEELGNISYSIYTRPDILVGVSGGSDEEGTSYAAQIATINSFTSDSEYYQEGDETYSPKLVEYSMTTIENMIDTVYALAEAIVEVEEETGKTTRYGDVMEIASDYETYVYGIIAYVQAELDAQGLEEKTFAFITAVNEDGTFTVGGADYTSATSLGRAYEYCIAAATPLTTETTTMTLDEVLEADVIITLNNSSLDADTMAEAGISEATYDGVIITNNPASLYGITMNSVENAVGYAYVIGSMYCDILDIDPVELCAYFYENFEHITNRDNLELTVLTNFSDTILPAGVSSILSEDYSSEKIEAMLVEGMLYYSANEELFDADQFLDSGIDEWEPNYEYGIGARAGEVTFTDVDSDTWYTDAVNWAYSEGITTGATSTTFNTNGTVTRAQAVTFLYRAAGEPDVSDVENPFTDVSESAYYYDAVLWAYSEGITTGTTDTTFDPNGTCVREQVVTFLYRYFDEPDTTGTSVFTDVVSTAYYYDAVSWAVSEGITTGLTDTVFGVGGDCTRAQIVTFLYRAIG